MEKEIKFLEDLKFDKIDNIEELKTSRGTVVFDEKEGSSKITTPDLRYYWDGGRLGLHISDSPDFDQNQWENLLNGIEVLSPFFKVLYIGRTKIEKFETKEVLKNIEELNLSENPILNYINIKDFQSLKIFNANQCPVLDLVKFVGEYPVLRHIDVSNCKIGALIFLNGALPELEYLNVQNNDLGFIELGYFPNLEYLFAQGNKKLELGWPETWDHHKLSILGLDESNELLSLDFLEIAKNSVDSELREKLEEYLQFLIKHSVNESIPINRYQLILLGNTTSGKTELKYRFLGEKRENFESTHGVQYFLKEIDGIEVMGYDFGGQDYYHALHLPFFDTQSHYIIVWGNHVDKTWGDYDSFYGKSELIKSNKNKELEILLYPIEYWLNSIQYWLYRFQWSSNYLISESKRNLQNEINYLNKLREFKEKHSNLSDEDAREVFFKNDETKVIVDIIQNVRVNTLERFLNIKDLKDNKRVRVDEIISFDFAKKEVRTWLLKKIKNRSHIQKNSILKIVKDFGEELYKEGIVIIDQLSLKKRIKLIDNKYDDSNIYQFINSLINYKYLLFPVKNNPEVLDFYIVNIQKFSEYIYQILSKELAIGEKNQGYFYKFDAFNRINCKNNFEKEFVLNFLITSDIIYQVEGSDTKNPRYVAPSYLPAPTDKVEILFIDSFESPDCEFVFHKFFHPNIILQVIKYYKNEGLLVKNDAKEEYLLWKNCIIIYNNSKESKQYLKLELLLPNIDNKLRIPTFTISRSSSGFISNDQFYEVFIRIKDLLNQYSPSIKVKTPYGNCIPFEDITNSLFEGRNKQSQFIYSGGVLYPKYDFRHFLGDKMDAPLKIFIAYSKYDDHYRQELRDHLVPGINAGKFIVFDDRELEMGEKWNARLKNELEQCNIFIVLISVKLLGTAFVINTEIPEALKRKEKISILPIMLSPCDWSKTGLKDFNIYDKAQPIALFNSKGDLSINERAAKWQEIVNLIENLKQ